MRNKIKSVKNNQVGAISILILVAITAVLLMGVGGIVASTNKNSRTTTENYESHKAYLAAQSAIEDAILYYNNHPLEFNDIDRTIWDPSSSTYNQSPVSEEGVVGLPDKTGDVERFIKRKAYCLVPWLPYDPIDKNENLIQPNSTKRFYFVNYNGITNSTLINISWNRSSGEDAWLGYGMVSWDKGSTQIDFNKYNDINNILLDPTTLIEKKFLGSTNEPAPGLEPCVPDDGQGICTNIPITGNKDYVLLLKTFDKPTTFRVWLSDRGTGDIILSPDQYLRLDATGVFANTKRRLQSVRRAYSNVEGNIDYIIFGEDILAK